MSIRTNTLRSLPVLALAPLAACANSGEIATTTQALEAECSPDEAALPEDAWVCPEPLEVECEADGEAEVETLYVLPSEGALAECGAPLAVSDEGPFALGDHVIDVQLEGEVDGGPVTLCSAELSVVDTLPPELTELTPEPLWPPNHKMHRVTAEDCFEVVDCDPDVELRIVEVTSDEPNNDKGDGNTSPDVMFDGCDAVELRAERQGGGDGRVYTLTVEATDDEGLVAEGVCTVTVPHDQSGRVAVDSGVAETFSAPEGC